MWFTNLYVDIYVCREMASRKVCVNLSGPKSTFASSKATGGPSKNIARWTAPELITENVGDASTKENKLVSYWKKSIEVNRSKSTWFLKDIDDKTMQLYLYASKNFDDASYELVGKVVHLYIFLNTENVYIL